MNFSHIFQIYQIPRSPCLSVIGCIPTILMESHGLSRQSHGFPRSLLGVYTDHTG